MQEEQSLIEGYKKWAGDCPTSEPERAHWLAGFGAYVLGWQDREERLLTPRAADGSRAALDEQVQAMIVESIWGGG